MNLLDKLRGRPGWQQDDPAVRAAAVDDLGDDAQAVFVTLASEDTDASVRVVAVARLTNPEVLERITRTDSTERVRTEATTRLRAMALDGSELDIAGAALAGLSSVRDLSEVARLAKFEAISGAALERLDAHHQKQIGSVARRSAYAAVRRAALERLDDPDELLAVAVKSDLRDIAETAYDRLCGGGEPDLALLKMVATRARVKQVARRARTAIAVLDALPVKPSPAEFSQRRERLCDSVEALLLVGVGDLKLVNDGLVVAEEEWLSLGVTVQAVPTDINTERPAGGGRGGNADSDADRGLDAAVVARWTSAVTRVGKHLAQLDAARHEVDRRRQEHVGAAADAAALCERLASVVADVSRDLVDRVTDVETIRVAWQALRVLPTEPLDPLIQQDHDGVATPGMVDVAQRFGALVASFEDESARQRSSADRVTRLTELVEALENISQADNVGDLERHWTAPQLEWTQLLQSAAPDAVAELVARAAAAQTRRSERLIIVREERRRHDQANLVKQQHRCDELEEALADENIELKDAERWLRLTRSLSGNLGRVSTKADLDTLTKRLQDAQSAWTGRVRELRGLIEWKQWANIGVQATLCQRLESLAAETDPGVVTKKFRQVMVAWREASDVPRGAQGDDGGSEAIWQRFKLAHDAVQLRVDADLAKKKVRGEESLIQKVALCEEVERLAESNDWVQTAQRITELQAQWKLVEPTFRRQEREVWDRFRSASGRFFKRCREDLAERKQVWAKNALQKEALCERAEALSEESDLGAAKKTVRQLQADWKTIGSVRRSRSEQLWQRFRAACDPVFARVLEAVDAECAEKVKARASVCERLEALLPVASDDKVPEGLTDTVAAARVEWRGLPPVPSAQDLSLSARFKEALSGVVARYPVAFSGSDLDPDLTKRTLERLCERVEAILESPVSVAVSGRSSAEILATKLREALANNTLGSRVDPAEKRRADVDKVRRLQSERLAVGVVPGEIGRELSDRFRAACDRFSQQQPSPPTSAPRPQSDGSSRVNRSRPRSRSGRQNSV